MSEERKSPFRLSFGQKLKVVEWLRNNTEVILAERPLQAELARRVSEFCGFAVSGQVVGDLCKEINLTYRPKLITGGNAHAAQHLREALRLVGELETEVSVLRAALKQLYRDLGVVPHPSYLWRVDAKGLPLAGDGKVEG